MIRRFRFNIFVLLLSFFSCQAASCQIKVEAIQLPSRLRSAPQWQQDQYRIETAIDVAHQATKKISRNVTVYLSSGKLVRTSESTTQKNSATNSGYEFKVKTYRLRRPVVVPGGVVLAGEGLGRREARLLWEDCQSNSALLIFKSGFGGGLRNVDIRLASNLKNKTNVTALYLQSQSSAVFRDFAIDLSNIGPDSNGIVIARLPSQEHNESLKFQDFNISASRPVIIMSGDNLHFENFDCICSTPVTNGFSAVFQNWNGKPPGNWTIGPGTGQKGDHAIALTGTTNRRGTSLVVFGYQWEQGSGKGPAWLFDIDHPVKTNPNTRAHFIESLTMINCRNARQTQSPDYVSVRLPDDSYLKAEFIGGFLYGKMEVGRPRRFDKPKQTKSS